MSSKYIYAIGKGSDQSNIVEAIHAAGYKAGLFADKTLPHASTRYFDRVEIVDFLNLDKELERLAALNLNIHGLQCTYENYILAKAKLAKTFNLPSLTVESARLTTDKSLMRRAFLNADQSVSPQFKQINTADEAVHFANMFGYPVIIKPASLVKSLLVLKCDNEEQLRERFVYASETIGQLYKKYQIYDRVPQIIIEEFIIGKQYSIAAFVDEKGIPHFCDGIVSLNNAQDKGADDNYLYSRTLPTELPPETSRRMFEVAEIGIKALGMQSVPAHIELMHSEEGVKIIEIGARVGGYRPRMYYYSYGLDLTAQEVALSIGQKPALQGHFLRYCAVYELFPDKEGAFQKVEESGDTKRFEYFRITAAPGSPVGPAKNGYKTSVIIIVAENDYSEFTSLCKTVDSMKVVVE